MQEFSFFFKASRLEPNKASQQREQRRNDEQKTEMCVITTKVCVH